MTRNVLGRLGQFTGHQAKQLSDRDIFDVILLRQVQEEEAQWTTYDEDTVAAKFAVADQLLSDMLDDAVEDMAAIGRQKQLGQGA